MAVEKYLDTNIPELYIVAKGFNDKGSIYYRLKNRLEVRSVPDILELLRPEGMQIVLLDNKEVYGEYAPYKEIKELREFINLVVNHRDGSCG